MMGDPDHTPLWWVLHAMSCPLSTCREHSKAVVPMATSHQNLVVGGEDKQFGADYQILSKWSSQYPCSIKCTLSIDFTVWNVLINEYTAISSQCLSYF